MHITSEQIRAARAMLRWEQAKLAETSGVSLPTLKRLEGQQGPLAAHGRTIAALQRALEDAGIEFTNGGAPGVRLRPLSIGDRVRLVQHTSLWGQQPEHIRDAVAEVYGIPQDPTLPRVSVRYDDGTTIDGHHAGLFVRFRQAP